MLCSFSACRGRCCLCAGKTVQTHAERLQIPYKNRSVCVCVLVWEGAIKAFLSVAYFSLLGLCVFIHVCVCVFS